MIRVPTPTEFLQENFINPEAPLHEERRACKRTFQAIQAGCAALLQKRESNRMLTEAEKITLRKFDILSRFVKQPVE